MNLWAHYFSLLFKSISSDNGYDWTAFSILYNLLVCLLLLFFSHTTLITKRPIFFFQSKHKSSAFISYQILCIQNVQFQFPLKLTFTIIAITRFYRANAWAYYFCNKKLMKSVFDINKWLLLTIFMYTVNIAGAYSAVWEASKKRKFQSCGKNRELHFSFHFKCFCRMHFHIFRPIFQ